MVITKANKTQDAFILEKFPLIKFSKRNRLNIDYYHFSNKEKKLFNIYSKSHNFYMKYLISKMY